MVGSISRKALIAAVALMLPATTSAQNISAETISALGRNVAYQAPSTTQPVAAVPNAPTVGRSQGVGEDIGAEALNFASDPHRLQRQRERALASISRQRQKSQPKLHNQLWESQRTLMNIRQQQSDMMRKLGEQRWRAQLKLERALNNARETGLFYNGLAFNALEKVYSKNLYRTPFPSERLSSVKLHTQNWSPLVKVYTELAN